MFSFLRSSLLRAPLAKSHRALVLPLGALLVASGATARAQSAPPAPVRAADGPQLTNEMRPSSSIAATRRPNPVRARGGRSLLMAFPSEQPAAPVTVPAVTPAQPPIVAPLPSSGPKTAADSPTRASSTGLSSNTAPQTLISPAKRVRVASKSRFDASRVATQTPEPLRAASSGPTSEAPGGASALTTSPEATSVAPSARLLPPPGSVGALPSPASPATPMAGASPRDRMFRLPSRGGMAANRAPIDLQPGAPETGAISESQRRLLAELDADLGRAQRRLSRAETRLSDGERQLANFTGVLQTAMLDAGTDARGLHPFVRVAQRYAGTPYVWGGESARGFDCSGFIMRVMRDLGYRALPHSAAEQFNYGLPVAKALLKPGDIVFFANTYKPGVSHVGIYLGRGRFIHAANSKVGTIVSGLNDPKWVAHYAGARRLLPVKS